MSKRFHFTKAAELDQNFVQLMCKLGRSYISLGRWGSHWPIENGYRISERDTKETTNFLSDAIVRAGIQSF